MSIRHERKDAMENRQLILQTAKQLFHDYGVQSVSMHQIAKTAGIGQATLYRRYADKGDLCFDVLQHYGKQFINDIMMYLDKNNQAAPIDRLTGILDLWIDEIEEKAELIVAMSTKIDINCEDGRGNFFLSPIYHFIRDKLSELILESLGPNQEPQAEPDFAAHTIICSMSPIGYFHIKNEKAYTKEHMKAHYRQLFCFLFKRD